jgi:hypothetical protein
MYWISCAESKTSPDLLQIEARCSWAKSPGSFATENYDESGKSTQNQNAQLLKVFYGSITTGDILSPQNTT